MKNLKREVENIRMTPEEKQAMRLAVFGMPSPLALSRVEGYFSFFTTAALLNLRSAVAAVLVFALVGSGTAYAAQGALPGDLLYTVKVSVNEPVELALATTPEEKVQTEVRFAERRIAEAQALDAEGRLDAVVTEEMEKEFDKHAERALAFAQTIETSEVEVALETATSGAGTDDSQMRTKEAPQAMMMQVADESLMAATSTASSTVEDEDNDDLLHTLQEKKNIFRELRERSSQRRGGEVRGESDEERSGKNEDEGDKKGDKNKDEKDDEDED